MQIKNKIYSPKKEKAIGILGGMGPISTAYLFRKIIELTPVKKDQDHLRIIIDNNPKVPDRTNSILNNDRRIISYLISTAKNLHRAGADFILLACNTSHNYLKELQNSVKIPVLNMIKLTVESINNNPTDKYQNIGLLATDGTLKKTLYQKSSAPYKINWITLNRIQQKKLMNIIYQIKAGRNPQILKDNFKDFLLSLKRKGAEYIILGCTELSLFKDMFGRKFRLIDPIEILAKEAIKSSRPDS